MGSLSKKINGMNNQLKKLQQMYDFFGGTDNMKKEVDFLLGRIQVIPDLMIKNPQKAVTETMNIVRIANDMLSNISGELWKEYKETLEKMDATEESQKKRLRDMEEKYKVHIMNYINKEGIHPFDEL